MEYQGDTEDAAHGPVDILILNPIKTLCLRNQCTISTNRNGIKKSGAALTNLRPDVLLWLPWVLALKGERNPPHHVMKLLIGGASLSIVLCSLVSYSLP